MDPKQLQAAIQQALGSRQMSELTPDELKNLAQQLVPQWAGKDPTFLRQQFAQALGSPQAAQNIAQATPQQVQPTAGARPADPTMPDLNPTDQDRKLVEQSIGAAGDIARRQLEATLPQIMDRTTARAGAQIKAPNGTGARARLSALGRGSPSRRESTRTRLSPSAKVCPAVRSRTISVQRDT